MIFLYALTTSVIVLCSSGMTIEDITGLVNDTVTLPCTYSVREAAAGLRWRRASCTNTTCISTILHTNGSRVNKRTSKRYKLLGNVTWGDASLTITKLATKDKGTYWCKVSIPGPCNDVRREIHLQVMEYDEKLSWGTLGNVIRGIIILMVPAMALFVYKRCEL
ncbi:hepatitis A virus cellular receptor 1 homolog isoform X2 [Phyllobates terribilis]|uniref:hepatitis A virus cellular receptor 1 homolog isoform X2 n=1 Tax=Phyllobates terribilis TaxID=111132 RepID=UPI003CCB303F